MPGRTVLYIYPMTGRPDRALPEGWNEIPGARGCTPQSCSFRDHYAEFKALNTGVFGVRCDPEATGGHLGWGVKLRGLAGGINSRPDPERS